MSSKNDELFGAIEAEQSLILKLIEDNKRHCARSDMLMDAARKKLGTKESEGEMEDA